MDIAGNIGHRFLKLARTRPNVPALIVPNGPTFTYADLGNHIDFVATRIRSWACEPGDLIAGLMTDRLAMALACVSIPASVTFAPLSPHLPKDAYVRLLQRLRPRVLVLACEAMHPIRQAVEALGLSAVELHAGDDGLSIASTTIRAHNETGREPARRTMQWAYLMSSSGSTGESKLVPVSHESMNQNAAVLADWFRLGRDDLGCHLTPLHLPQGLRVALMVPLLCGTPVSLLPENDADGFFKALDDGITWITGGFTLVRHLAERALEYSAAIARSRLRFVRCGSGTLPPETIDLIEQRLRAPMIAAYSTVETGAIAIDPMPPRPRKPGGVGVPVHDGVRIVDDAGAPCPVGATGQIEVRGAMVFAGYFDDPVKTAESFRDGWFRTGDLGRFDGDGYLFIQGRVKEVINRGGEKILPAEVDAVIEQVPGILEAAAFAVPHPTLGEELGVAVVCTPNGSRPSVGAIKARLYAALGRRGLPRCVLFLDRLPRTGTGKIKRGELALRVPASDATPQSEEAAPTPLMTALRSLWSTTLNARYVGANDDFFMLGGDSLKGTRLLLRVHEVFGVSLPLDSLFNDGATVAGMAQLIEAARSAQPGTCSNATEIGIPKQMRQG